MEMPKKKEIKKKPDIQIYLRILGVLGIFLKFRLSTWIPNNQDMQFDEENTMVANAKKSRVTYRTIISKPPVIVCYFAFVFMLYNNEKLIKNTLIKAV